MTTSTAQNITADNFDSFVGSSTPTLIDFWAPWCAPCRALGPVIDTVAAELEGKAQVGKVNVDDEKEIAAKFGISSIPTVLIFKDGKVTDTLIGIRPKAEYEQALTD